MLGRAAAAAASTDSQTKNATLLARTSIEPRERVLAAAAKRSALVRRPSLGDTLDAERGRDPRERQWRHDVLQFEMRLLRMVRQRREQIRGSGDKQRERAQEPTKPGGNAPSGPAAVERRGPELLERARR